MGFCSSYVVILWISLSVSPMWGTVVLPYDLTSPRDLRRAVDFSMCPAFYLLGWIDEFQIPYISNQKPGYFLRSSLCYWFSAIWSWWVHWVSWIYGFHVLSKLEKTLAVFFKYSFLLPPTSSPSGIVITLMFDWLILPHSSWMFCSYFLKIFFSVSF